MLNYPEKVETVEYSEAELKYRGYLIERMELARDLRDQAFDEFDGQSYLEYYESNSRAACSYIPPKKNAREVRIVTGTTESKIEAILSSLLNFNFEPNITAYDERNTEIAELGENTEALIRKSREIENPDWEVKKPMVYREALIQGTVFLEETMIEWQDLEKKLKKGMDWIDGIGMKQTWEESKSKVHRECRVNLLAGPNVYLGNIKDFYMDSQPYVFVRTYITYEEAKSLFGEWSRFKHVPAIINSFADKTESRLYNDWSLLEQKPGFVEMIKYYDKPNNEFQIVLNGVLMLPQGFPLSTLLGRNVYPIIKGDIGPISKFFAYSRSFPARTKVDQEMLDEFYRLAIWKTRKSVAPSLANNTGKELTSKIFDPATITNGIDPNRLQEIGKNDGVSQAEFNMIGLIRETIDGKSVSPVFEGNQGQGNQTATEIVTLQKQSIQKLGGTVYGIMNMEEQMSWLRLYNVLNSWTQEQDKRVNKIRGRIESEFMRVEIDDTLEDGSAGTRVINFTEELPSSSQIMARENLQRGRGKKILEVYLNPKLLRDADINWKITIVPTEKEADALEQAQFTADIAEGAQLFGNPVFNQIYNGEYVKSVWAQKRKLDKDQLFAKQPMQMPGQVPGQTPGQMPQQGQSVNGQMRQSLEARKPKLNQLARA